AEPVDVSPAAIATAKRGPLVGIPGAPATIAPPLTPAESAWTVCDGPTGTTVIVGRQPHQDIDRLGVGSAVLVTPSGGSAAATFLLYDGRRAQVDLRNNA